MAPIQFGILLIPFQLVDCAMPLDILSSCSRPYLTAAAPLGIPAAVAEKGIDIEFHHIGATMDPVEHTGHFYSTPTCTVANCPKLDYLLVGGPDPGAYFPVMPQAFKDFLRERVQEVKTMFSTCTGGMVLAYAGLLDGVDATTNHGAVEMSKNMFPKVKWTKEKQWVVSGDGKFWTAGGACAGMDMMAHWVMQNYDMAVAQCGFVALDYCPRDVDRKIIDENWGKTP